MRQSLKTSLVLTAIIAFFLLGMTVIEPTKAHGQPQGKIGFSQKGERDPFLFPPGVRLLSKNNAAVVAKGTLPVPETKPIDIPPPPLTVKAILISDHVRLASIDRFIVTVGDSIGDEKVLEIGNDGVILGKGDKRRTLLLSQRPIRLTIEER